MKAMMKGEAGIALFLVLWVLTLLSVIAGEFCFAMRTEVNITRNFKDQTISYYIALAGINRAIGEMIRNEVMPPTRVSSIGVPGQPEEKETEVEEEREFWRINVEIPPESYGEGVYQVRIENESGKINLNGANEAMLKMMLNRFDLDENEKSVIVDSILDWRDKNDVHRLNGAENEYYRSLPEPYECKDGDFDSVEELLMVRGVTPEIFYGGLKNIVTVFKPPVKRQRSTAGRHFRVVGADLNKVNINAATKDVLLSLPSMTEDLVQQIMDFRKESDFRSLAEVTALVGGSVYNAISPYITLESSPYFSIRSVGKMADGRIQQGIEAWVEIDRKLKKGFRIVQWRDRAEESEPATSDGE